MKIIKKNGDRTRTIYTGCVLIGAGLVWLLHNMAVIGDLVFNKIFSWQVLLVVIGGYLLAGRNRVAGWLVTAFGVFFLVTDLFHLEISFTRVILPLLLVIAGAAMLIGKR